MILVTHDLREAVFLADTVYVMSKSPGRIVVRREIDLPRPRDLEVTYTKEFSDIVHELREHIGAIRKPARRRRVDDAARARALRAVAAAGRDAGAVGGVCRGFGISEFIFPSPSRIANQLVEFRGVIAGHAWRTFWVTMVGFGLSIVVGTLLGFLIGSSRIAYAAIYPLMTGFNAMPKAAFVPILVVWFGIGVGPAVLTAFLISFFPITVNIATGLATLEPELEDVLRVLGAKRWDVLSRSACRARCRTSTAR